MTPGFHVLREALPGMHDQRARWATPGFGFSPDPAKSRAFEEMADAINYAHPNDMVVLVGPDGKELKRWRRAEVADCAVKPTADERRERARENYVRTYRRQHRRIPFCHDMPKAKNERPPTDPAPPVERDRPQRSSPPIS